MAGISRPVMFYFTLAKRGILLTKRNWTAEWKFSLLPLQEKG